MTMSHTPMSATPFPVWRPKAGTRTGLARSAYFAGYSDRWYKEHYGSGQLDPGQDYRQGWDDAAGDS